MIDDRYIERAHIQITWTATFWVPASPKRAGSGLSPESLVFLWVHLKWLSQDSLIHQRVESRSKKNYNPAACGMKTTFTERQTK